MRNEENDAARPQQRHSRSKYYGTVGAVAGALAVATFVGGVFLGGEIAGYSVRWTLLGAAGFLFPVAFICFEVMASLEIEASTRELRKLNASLHGTKWKTVAGAEGTALGGNALTIELAFPSGLKQRYRVSDLEPV